MIFKKKKLHKYFDENFYTKTYSDVKESGIDPYDHFMRFGIRERRNPCAVFDTEYYLSQVGSISEDPTEHYQKSGIALGAEPHPTFDREWYLLNNPDVVADGADPLWHYFRYGRAEGRKPGPLWRMHFTGAKRPLWRLANQKTARRALRLQFDHGEVAQPVELHAVYGFAVYMTRAQVFRFSKERSGYDGYLRSEAELRPNVVIILSNVSLGSRSDRGVEAKYDSGHVFSLDASASSLVSDLGGGRLSLDYRD
ncbi:hypothetical protein [Methylobacterium symbioticum]|uniref:Uncharacterized protein n=1 Tax=Methylobacterium symbioticum TaxID=2584084 RepID=A0A509EFB2_9HYPH|nr:hypothetical protein [Methylobacterium symbioticum]VUD73076.1 hypothetical protein MET9862_03689 [Methylobacterium symbioticum]